MSRTNFVEFGSKESDGLQTNISGIWKAITARHIAPFATALCSGAQFKVLDNGHYMSAMTPELLAIAIAEFLNQAGV